MKTQNGLIIVAIIQARLTSTRLPKKIMLDLCGKPLLCHVVERVMRAQLIDEVVLAIPDSSSNDQLELFAKQFNWKIFRDSEDDVLSRYYHAATHFKADIIVRITSDCPLVDPAIIDETIKRHILDRNDYTAVGIEGGFPRGLDVEVLNIESLQYAYDKAVDKSEREHVTLFIYQNPELFKTRFIEATQPLKRPEIRLTVDTEEDYFLIKQIYSVLHNGGNFFSTQDVLDLIDSNPHLQSINKHIIQKDTHHHENSHHHGRQ
ncbi:MAG: glycosyltransferase family protein [Desulfamplus sp.]|nr:glycosyltransferase family protein [Desulfamplus sp.]